MNKSATTQAEIDKVQCWIDKRRGEQTDLRASCQTTLNMSLAAKGKGSCKVSNARYIGAGDGDRKSVV